MVKRYSVTFNSEYAKLQHKTRNFKEGKYEMSSLCHVVTRNLQLPVLQTMLVQSGGEVRKYHIMISEVCHLLKFIFPLFSPY